LLHLTGRECDELDRKCLAVDVRINIALNVNKHLNELSTRVVEVSLGPQPVSLNCTSIRETHRQGVIAHVNAVRRKVVALSKYLEVRGSHHGNAYKALLLRMPR
jgi:hypothetical protein